MLYYVHFTGGFMTKNRANVLSMLENKTSDYSRKTALGMKTTFGWREQIGRAHV